MLTFCFCSSMSIQCDINFELEKLRVELRHVRGMYEVAKTEAMDSSRKVIFLLFVSKYLLTSLFAIYHHSIISNI